MSEAFGFVSRYLELGFTVIPILPLAKEPATSWKRYQLERPTAEEIDGWRRLWEKGYNVAIVCGYASRGLVVIDIDSYRNNTLLSVLNLEKLKKGTMVVETPSGGYHIYFRCTGPTPSFNLMHNGRVLAEVRGDGRYVLAPPSKCAPKGGGDPRSYCIVSSTDTPATLDGSIRHELARVLKSRGIEVSTVEDSPKLVDRAMSSGKPYRGPPMPCIERLAAGVGEGFRNEAAMRMASFYLNLRKYSPGEAWNCLKTWNEANDPPLPERELRSCFENVLRKGYVYGCSSLSIVYCDRLRCPLNPVITIPADVSGYDWFSKSVKRRRSRLRIFF